MSLGRAGDVWHMECESRKAVLAAIADENP